MRKDHILTIVALLACLLAVGSCARMGNPDGGWYDETPPHVVGASPADRSAGVKSQKVQILFDEYIKLENATEKVVVSPPQLEQPEIKSTGKRITVELKDSLKPHTTYTIDFSDAISDNNEGNPLGNYTYSFSTGEAIDTFEVAGYVLQAENLEPVKGILVGLYDDLADSAFTTKPMLRVSRTDSRGRFVIKGVAPGTYRAFALQDADGNYIFNQKSEMLAFNHQQIVPTSKPDIRQDTTWLDSLRIKTIDQVPYTHFLPDDIVLRAFTEQQTDRYFLKADRSEPDHFSLYFTYADTLPTVRGLNFNADGAFLVETSEKLDTVTYWLRDTALVNSDTLDIELTYLATDTAGIVQLQTDTVQILSKKTHEKRMKQAEKEFEEWQKKQEKLKKKGEPYDSIMPQKFLEMNAVAPSALDPDRNISFEFATPLARIDTSMIHLYSKIDTLWYNAPFEFRQQPGRMRSYTLLGEWRPDIEYSLEIDSAAFTDIYGLTTKPYKQGFKVHSLDDYSTVVFNLPGMESKPVVVELLDASDKPVKTVSASGGYATFFYVTPGKYYARLFVDDNGNGLWDTGEYAADRQPEEVFYYPELIECKAKWDLSLTWRTTSKPIYEQKPAAIVKQKGELKKKVQQRNLERARKLGKEYVPTVL